MRVIKKSRLLEFWKKHASAESGLLRWYVIAEKADWKDLDNVRLQFPHADQVRVGSNRHVVVFNIGGNEYRLIAAIHYNTQTVYVLMIMTHAEYSKEKWKSKL